MQNPDDWRLTNQINYLKDVVLIWHQYAPTSSDNDHDHDHCEFCFAKFMDNKSPDTLHEGYSPPDGKRWVCKSCFNDFFKQFNWVQQ